VSHADIGDERVRSHLESLAAVGELTTRVDAIESRGSLTPEDLWALVVEVKGFRVAGRIDDHVEVTDHAIAIAEAVGWRRLHAELANVQGVNHLRRWRLELAERFFERAADLWAEEGVPAERGRSLVNLAQVHLDRGTTAGAKQALTTAEALSRSNGLKELEAQVLGFLGSLRFDHEGRYDEANTAFARSLALHTELGNKTNVREIERRIELLRKEVDLIRLEWPGVPSTSDAPLYRGEGRLEIAGAWSCSSHETLADHLRGVGFATRDPEGTFVGTIADQILQQGYVNRNTVSLTESFDVARTYALGGGRNARGVVFTIDRARLSTVRPVYDSFATMKQSLAWFFKSEMELIGDLVQALGVRDGGHFLDRVAWETRRAVESGRDLEMPLPDWTRILPAELGDRLRDTKIHVERLNGLYHAFRGFWLLLADGGPLGYYGAFRSVQARLCDVQAASTDENRRNPGWQTTPFGYVAKTCRDREFFSTGLVPPECIVKATPVDRAQ
jgi:tetratricopeptide (TPR) repeat protein